MYCILYIYRKSPKWQLCLVLSSIIAEFTIYFYLSAFCCYSVTQSCPTLCNSMDCSTLGFTISQSLLKLMSIELMMPSNHLTLCHPFLLLLSIFPSIRLFSNELVLHIRWPEYWSFSISPSNEYSGLISFRIDSFELPAVQRTFKSLLQYHGSKASVLEHSAFFFMVQLSHPHMTTGTAICIGKKQLTEVPNIPISHDTCSLGFAFQDPSLLCPISVRKSPFQAFW